MGIFAVTLKKSSQHYQLQNVARSAKRKTKEIRNAQNLTFAVIGKTNDNNCLIAQSTGNKVSF